MFIVLFSGEFSTGVAGAEFKVVNWYVPDVVVDVPSFASAFQ